MFCNHCGNKLHDKSRFCGGCGKKVEIKSNSLIAEKAKYEYLEKIDETLFLIPRYFANEFSAIFIKQNFSEPNLIQINEPSTAQKEVREFLRKNINRFKYILIIGNWAEIPPYKIPNPSEADYDEYCMNDSLYGSTNESYADIDSIIPDIQVSRIPLARQEIISKLIFSPQHFLRLRKSFSVAVSAECWMEATKKILWEIFNKDTNEYQANRSVYQNSHEKRGIFCTPGWTESEFSNFVNNNYLGEKELLLFNVHGSPDTPDWVGEGLHKNYSEIFQPNSITDYKSAFLLSEACYGGAMGYENESIVENFFRNNGAGFIGSSTIAYGSPDEDIFAADNIALYFFKKLQAGDEIGVALAKAKLKVINENIWHQDISLKTVYSFNLYGVPWLKIDDSLEIQATLLDSLRNNNRQNLSIDLLRSYKERYRIRLPSELKTYLTEVDNSLELIKSFRDYKKINEFILKAGKDSSLKVFSFNSPKVNGYKVHLKDNFRNGDLIQITTDISGIIKSKLVTKKR